MNHVIPPSFLFDYRARIPRCAEPGKRPRGRLLQLADNAALFVPSAMNEGPNFASICIGWCEGGLACVFRISGKTIPPAGSSTDISRSDSVLVWLDTRPTGNVHRATEYCHHFALLPADDEAAGEPGVRVLPIAQQRATRIESDPRKIQCRTHLHDDGYELEVWIPGSQLNGYREISELGRLGFYCVVQDSELGEQPLSVDDEFPVAYDPSTWIELELLS